MFDPSKRSLFLIQKDICNNKTAGIGNDDTVKLKNKTRTEFPRSVCMTMMFKVPSIKYGIDDDDAPLEATSKMDEMLKALINKLPCQVSPWDSSNKICGNLTVDNLFTTLPEDVDFVESYILD